MTGKEKLYFSAFAFSHKYCIPLRNFAFTPKSVAFPKEALCSECFCILSQVLHFLKKLSVRSIFSLELCVLWETAKFCERIQCFSGKRQSFVSEHNVYLGNSKVLWANTMFLWETAKFCEWTQCLSGKRQSFANKCSFLGKWQSFASERKVSWGTQTFCKRAQCFMGGCKSFASEHSFLGKWQSFASEHKISWENGKVLRQTPNFFGENGKVLRANTKFLGGTQRFCEWTRSFLGKWQRFVSERKLFLGNAKLFKQMQSFSQNTNVLRVTSKFLRGTQRFCERTQKHNNISIFFPHHHASLGVLYSTDSICGIMLIATRKIPTVPCFH